MDEYLSIFKEEDRDGIIFYVGNEEWKQIPTAWKFDWIRKSTSNGLVPQKKTEVEWSGATIIHDPENKFRFDIETT